MQNECISKASIDKATLQIIIIISCVCVSIFKFPQNLSWAISILLEFLLRDINFIDRTTYKDRVAMKIHMHDPSTQKAEQEGPKFSLGCIVKSRPV